MTNNINWTEIKEKGGSAEAVLYVVNLAEKTKNTTYIAGNYRDSRTSFDANMFGTPLAELKANGIENGSIVFATVSSKGNGFLNIESIRLATDDEKRQLAAMADIDTEAAFRELIDIVHSHKSSPCETGITDVTLGLLEENKDAFMRSSAACKHHHNKSGGLLQHSLRMTRAAEKIASEYTELNDELLICATALHDIGKIRSLETSELGIATMTPAGVLEDHALIGVLMINEYIIKHNINIPDDCKMVLEHMIASHHGKREFGAIQVPAIPEAMVLNYLDLIDSRMYMFMNALEGVEGGSLSGYQEGLNTSVYNYDLNYKLYE